MTTTLLNSMTSVDGGARLEATVPLLIEAVNDWQAKGLVDYPLTVAVATPRSAMILAAENWPDVDCLSCTSEEVAAELIKAVEAPVGSSSGELIVTAVAALLGAA